MKKTLLASLARRVGARRLRRRRRRAATAAGDLGVPASASQSPAGFIAYLQLLVASMADLLEPVDTSAVVPPADDVGEPTKSTETRGWRRTRHP
jgi:hypothetical protein